MQNQGMTASAVIVSFLLLVLVIGGGLAGCPYYKVWERKMAGQAELQYQQGARQALIAQAAAEDEAAIKRAEAATRRVLGWTDAAKRGCEALGRPGDRACEEQLVRDAATYSICINEHMFSRNSVCSKCRSNIIRRLVNRKHRVHVDPVRIPAAPVREDNFVTAETGYIYREK